MCTTQAYLQFWSLCEDEICFLVVSCHRVKKTLWCCQGSVHQLLFQRRRQINLASYESIDSAVSVLDPLLLESHHSFYLLTLKVDLKDKTCTIIVLLAYTNYFTLSCSYIEITDRSQFCFRPNAHLLNGQSTIANNVISYK